MNRIKKRTIFSLGTVSFGIKIVGAVLSFLVSIIIARYFHAEGTGLYSLANSVLNIFVILSAFGFENSIIKFASIYYEQKGYAAIRQLEKYSLLISASLSCLSFFIILVFAKKISVEIFQKPNLEGMLQLIVLAVFPICGIRIFSSLLKGVGRIKEGLLLETIFPSLFNAGFLIIYCIFQKTRAVTFTVNSFLLANIAACFCAVFLWKRFHRSLENGKNIDFTRQTFLRTSFNLMLVSATNYILTTTDTLMLGYWNTEIEVGIYNIAMKITTVSSMLLIAVNAVIGPHCATLYAKREMRDIIKIYERCLKKMFICAITFLVICVFLRKVILGYFGSDFLSGENVLVVAAVGQFVVLSTGPAATILMMIGYEKMHRNNTIGCALINIILNIILIPRWGILGAAVATTISLIIKNLIAVTYLRAVLKKYR